MQLIGMMDSPFVRRVAISARLLNLEYEHKPLSIFRNYEQIRKINTLVKVPSLICDNGELLIDSTLIIGYLESLSGKTLLPLASDTLQLALKHIGVALVTMEKVAQLIYETNQRPEDLQLDSWITRLKQQLHGALNLMETGVGNGQSWLFGENILQPDLSTAVAWGLAQHIFPEMFGENDYSGLVQFSARAEATQEFLACPMG